MAAWFLIDEIKVKVFENFKIVLIYLVVIDLNILLISKQLNYDYQN